MFWRPVRAAHQELDGEGERLYGARWNSPGRPVIYTASSLSLAELEVLVHASRENLPGDLVALGIEGPDAPSLETIDVDALPEDWYELPNHPACRNVGDEWLVREASVLLRVLSAVIPEETNVLVNPRHPEADGFHVAYSRPFTLDACLRGS